MTHLTTLVYL